ncbi:MAG TPA: hypothetical protein VGL62_00100, partial [Vicinamibacterales bacterium]
QPLLADRAIVAFNDPYSPGVNAALRARLFAPGSGLREPRHVNNTLFVEVDRGKRTSPLTAFALHLYLYAERLRFRALKLVLKGLFESTGVVYVPEHRYRG